MTITIDDATVHNIAVDDLTGEVMTTTEFTTLSGVKKLVEIRLPAMPAIPGKMRPDVKCAWVAALRSGEFPQTKGKLRDSRGYCCLGVLSEIARRHGIVGTVQYNSMSGGYAYDGQANFPPNNVVAWAGLTSHDPVVPTRAGRYASLAALNDANTPFSQIADMIEQSL